MKALFFLCLVSLAFPAFAQTVRVQGGAHDGFTRLAIVFPSSANWRFARIDDGYALSWPVEGITYDLSRTFDLIDKSRLRAIWTDPKTGWLHLGIGCACHAIAFEASANTVVIDIRDGAPNVDSAFERDMISSGLMPALGDQPKRRPKPRPAMGGTYDWLNTGVISPSQTATFDHQMQVQTAAPDLDRLRQQLAEQMGRKATEGLIRLAPEGVTDSRTTDGVIAPLVGMTMDPTELSQNGVSGEECPKDIHVDLRLWVPSDDPFRAISAARGAILGEFDAPASDPLQGAINTYLFFGFGAEARDLIRRYPSFLERPDLSLALSHLVEGDRPDPNPFLGLQSCEGATALWSLLSAESGKQLVGFNRAAALQTFSGLPADLRGVLAPEVFRSLTEMGDVSGAEMVRQSLGRALPDGNPTETLITAEGALHGNAPDKAEQILLDLPVDERGQDVLVALSKAAFQQRKPMDPRDLLTLESYAFAASSGPQAEELAGSVARMRALAGDYAGAFDLATPDSGLFGEIWLLLAEVGPNGELLDRAAQLSSQEREALPNAVRHQIADRLLSLGLPDLAEEWSPISGRTPAFSLQLAMSRMDPAAIKTELARLDQSDQVNADLRATALARSGDFQELADHLDASGLSEPAEQARRWSGLWDATTSAIDGPWKDLAAATAPTRVAPDAGPLQAARTLTEASVSTAAKVDALLAATHVE